MEITVLTFILNLAGERQTFLKILPAVIFFFNRGGQILPLPTHLSHLLFFTIFHPSRFSLLGQFLLLIHRTSSWFLCLHRYYISKKLPLSYNRVNFSVLNTWDFGSASQGCQAKGCCEFLALFWTPGLLCRFILFILQAEDQGRAQGSWREKHIAYFSTGSIKAWNILLLPENRKNFKDPLMTS